ncbi:hypothetical protein F4802DRAFT_602747 [Xylaria palmicola]|nr:hypothetical protein F4802DRAFT_602747 [Xylaria palmicola]
MVSCFHFIALWAMAFSTAFSLPLTTTPTHSHRSSTVTKTTTHSHRRGSSTVATTSTRSHRGGSSSAVATLSTVNPAELTRGEYVVTLVNSHTAAITTLHGQNGEVLTALHDSGTTLAVNSTAIVAVPTGWGGRIAMAEAGVPIRDRASLIEGSVDLHGRVTLDVSYVDGFTVPIVCECNNTVVLGCNLDFIHSCPTEHLIGNKTCVNPQRDAGRPVENLFAPCRSLAYTFSTDDVGSHYGLEGVAGCEKSARCCVGTACAPNPGQRLCPDADGLPEPCPWARDDDDNDDEKN